MLKTNPRRISIVIPVYGADAAAKLCLASVRISVPSIDDILIIDDASPDAALINYLHDLAAQWPGLRVLRNPRNLGFVETANRGFHETEGDVILLNSDTYVTQGWLQALQDCVVQDPRIATATPFSNNATICSWPRFCAENPSPVYGEEANQIATAIKRAAWPLYPELPTAVGFCMYVRRSALQHCGEFDPAFSPGYGEENDFSRRVAKSGFRNVLCDDAYVVHTGGQSFQGETSALKEAHARLLATRHPEYDQTVADFIAADFLKAQRHLAASQLQLLRRQKPAVLGLGKEPQGAVASDEDYTLICEPNCWKWLDRGAQVEYCFAADWVPLDTALFNRLCALFQVGKIEQLAHLPESLSIQALELADFAKMPDLAPLSREDKRLLWAALDPRWV